MALLAALPAVWAQGEPPQTEPVALTAEEKAWIAAHPLIRMASDPVWAPVDFLDAQGHHQGMTADYVALLNAKLGLHMEWQQARMPWLEVLQAARERRIDLIPTAGKTPEREEFLSFTEPPYVSFRSVIVVRSDEPFISGMEDLKGKRIALTPGYAETADFDQRFPDYHKVPVHSVEEGMVAVASGEADATVSNLAVVNWTIRTKALTNLRVAALYTDQERSVHLAVRKDWPQLVEILDKGLAAITADEHARIRNRWYEVQAQQGINPARVLRVAGLVLLAALLAAALVALWVRQLRREIAERKRVERRLEAAQQRLRDVTDRAPGFFFQLSFDADGNRRYHFVSGGIDKILGYDADEVMRDPNLVFQITEAEDRPAVLAAWEQSRRSLTPYRVEYRVRTRGGELLWLRGSASPLQGPDGVVWNGFTIDISDRKAAELLLQQAEQRTRQLTESLPGAVFQLVMDGGNALRYTYLTDGATALFGIPRETILADAQALPSRMPPEDLMMLAGAFRDSIREMKTTQLDFRVRHPDGQIRWMSTNATPGRNEHGVFGWTGYTLDTTDLKELQRKLAEAKQTADAANRAKSEFLANMSHEIRTPMNAIVGLSQLGRNAAPERVRDYLLKIHGAAQSLLQIINDILDFSKIEAGKLSLEHTHFDLYDVLENLSELLNVRAADKGLELLFAVDPAVPYALIGDPLRLGQVLLNLAGNALKFTERGQVVVRVSLLQQDEAGARLQFLVSDTGIGIAPEQMARLFESFSQADTSTTRRYGGTGLGLSISRRLVALMGGSIGAESKPGEGSTFSFDVPFGLSAAPAARLNTPEELRQLRVLAVDDNFTALDILRIYLQSFGLRVDTASSGPQALEAVRREAAADPYRLVLMDWQMPGMNGIEAAQQIFTLPLQPAPKVVMISAYGREEIMRQAEDAGLHGFLIKPINPSVLFDTILQAFGREAALAPRPAPGEAADGSALHGVRVLLAEDNEINQQVASELLGAAGAQVTVANNGREAVAEVARGDYDLVLMDVQMPLMDGFEATRVIRAMDGAAARLPIVAMTANAMSEDRQRCLDAGMNDYLSKPVDQRVLFATLARWVTPRAAPPAQLTAQAPPPGVDLDATGAVRRLGGNEGLLRKLAQRFLDEADPVALLRQQLAAGEHAAALLGAHTLKGVAGTLGTEGLYQAAASLEKALRRAEAAPALARETQDALLLQVAERHARACAALQHYVHGEPPAAVAAAAVGALAAQLDTALAGSEESAFAVYEQLRGALDDDGRQQLNAVGRCIAAYDFRRARSTLRESAAVLGIDY